MADLHNFFLEVLHHEELSEVQELPILFEKPYMKFTATLIASAEQSFKSIIFSSHLWDHKCSCGLIIMIKE